jgi:two-component system chemotaxis sensor kinase CheA
MRGDIMNEFIEQFLLECRELIETATADLLALENNAGDRQRIDSAFRAFHTLKGSAAIVEFGAMGRAVHAAEDALAAVRAGTRPVTPGLISDCLTCLDQVVQWLDAMQETGEIPRGADRDSEAVVARFSHETSPVVPRLARDEGEWVDALLGRHGARRARAKTAVHYSRWICIPPCRGPVWTPSNLLSVISSSHS